MRTLLLFVLELSSVAEQRALTIRLGRHRNYNRTGEKISDMDVDETGALLEDPFRSNLKLSQITMRGQI